MLDRTNGFLCRTANASEATWRLTRRADGVVISSRNGIGITHSGGLFEIPFSYDPSSNGTFLKDSERSGQPRV